MDHLIPRRLLVGAEVSRHENLAALCLACHAGKTHGVEPALYAGDILLFDTWLAPILASGPGPSTRLRARAWRRLRALAFPPREGTL